MSWPNITFGKYARSTLPKIVLDDPDWVFWAADEGALAKVARARELVQKAQAIRIPDGPHGPRVADYIAEMSGKLSHVEVGYRSDMIRDEDRGVSRLPHLDLSFARRLTGGAMDKAGSKAIVAAVRKHVFKPRGWTRMTVELCEKFFDDDTNFVL